MAQEEINAVIRDFVTAFSNSDAAGVAKLYCEHAQLIPPNSPPLQGHDAIQSFVQSAMDAGIAEVELETKELDIYGSVANEVGSYIFKDKDGAQKDAGSYVVIWQFVNGKWCLYRDILSSDIPNN